MSTFVIGDIHGGLKALPQVLKRANVTEKDTLIFLGDYVDGWSEAAQTIDFLIALSKTTHCIFIKGNHDLWCENWLKTKRQEPVWLAHGGQATLKSYASYSVTKKQEHISFFEQMKPYHIDSNNRLFIHAGYTSIHGVEKETFKMNYFFDRTLWEMAFAMDKALHKEAIGYPDRFKHYHEIYIGHTPTIRYQSTTPINVANLWNLDTGAAFTGRLSIMNIKHKKFWQSDIVKELYPNEKGRN
ncbi:metallophosphoesterase family protein [Tenacibaculum maritimum]|uniref:metallophosphoesterase family protein n=1 Tax=Tenacibaculum maritimum TaxID=107401 RepID=UPI0023081363|nr:metallophosphoesterase family protein [Tenacibaculum maritimum]MDB0602005.1 metallophosphoesterase family protein [Tenacibaculum maritimum]MDB0613228.1 metallophosphoesterase family protein [Tenacibaculum maritimum]